MDIMLDLETLSQRPDAAIIAIGAVRFDPRILASRRAEQELFFMTIDMHQAMEYGQIDTATWDWWQQQDAKVRETVFAGEASPQQAYEAFCTFCEGANNVWAKSPQFDVTILRNLGAQMEYVHLGEKKTIPFPFDFRHERDVRTHLDMGQRLLGVEAIIHNREFPAHHPLGDAMAQARQVQIVSTQVLALLDHRPWYQRLFSSR